MWKLPDFNSRISCSLPIKGEGRGEGLLRFCCLLRQLLTALMAVFKRRATEILTETAAEVLRIVEADTVGDAADRRIGRDELLGGTLHAHLMDEFVGRQIDSLL